MQDQNNLIQTNFACFKNLKLKSQLLLIVSFIILIIISLLLCWSFVNLNIVDNMFQITSKQIYNKYSSNIIQQLLSQYTDYFETLFQTNGNQLIQLSQLYNYIRAQTLKSNESLIEEYNMDFGGYNQIPSVIVAKNHIGNYNISYSFFCYTNKTSFHTPYTYDEYVSIKIQESLQAFGQIIFRGKTTQQQFLYAYLQTHNTLITYPCLQRYDIDKYIPEQRVWFKQLTSNYLSHQPYNEYNYSFTSPYILFGISSSVGLSVTLPFIDQKQKLIGGGSSDYAVALLFKQMISQLGNDLCQLFLATFDGQLIMHPYNITSKQLPLYIFNESITGFSINQWNELLTLINNGSTSYLKMNNNYFNKSLILGITPLWNYKLYLILLISNDEFFQFQYEFQEQFSESLSYQFKLQLIQQFSLHLSLLLILVVIIRILFSPIEYVVHNIESMIMKRKKKFQPLLITSMINKQIYSLYLSNYYLQQRWERISFQKTPLCYQIEGLQYPINLKGKFSNKQFLQNNKLKIHPSSYIRKSFFKYLFNLSKQKLYSEQ